MTTQAELMALGAANQEKSPAIRSVMTAIVEAQVQARVALGALGEQARVRREGVDFQEGSRLRRTRARRAATAGVLTGSSVQYVLAAR